MKKIFRQENVYTLIWCLYYMQGTLYAEGSVISQGLLAVFLLMSFYYFIKVFKYTYVPKPVVAFRYLAIMFGIYGLLRLGVSTYGWKYVNESTTYFKEYEISILPFFAFYYFSREHMINTKWFYKFSFIFFGTAIASYFYQEAQALMQSFRDEVTNNSGYFVVSLMPLLVFLRKNPLLQYIALFIVFILVLHGMKRGAILAVILGGAYFIWASIKKTRGTKKVLFVILSIAAVVGAIVFLQDLLANSDYMQLRLEQTRNGDMSERENMYPAYYHYFFDNAGSIEYLFGYGADGTLKNMGDFAHQDWLETMMNQGFLGLSLMLFFWVSMLMTLWRSSLRNCQSITVIIALFVIIYLMKSMVSMSINGMTLFTISSLAYAIVGLDDPIVRKELTN